MSALRPSTSERLVVLKFGVREQRLQQAPFGRVEIARVEIELRQHDVATRLIWTRAQRALGKLARGGPLPLTRRKLGEPVQRRR